MIMQINGPSTIGKIRLHQVLQRGLLWGVRYTQAPLPGQRSTHFVQLDSPANPPFPYVVVTAWRRGGAPHTFSVFGEFWAERVSDVLLTLFPELGKRTVYEVIYGLRRRVCEPRGSERLSGEDVVLMSILLRVRG